MQEVEAAAANDPGESYKPAKANAVSSLDMLEYPHCVRWFQTLNEC